MRVKSTSFGGVDARTAPSSSSMCRRPNAVSSPLPPPSSIDKSKSTMTSSVALACSIDRYSRLVFPLLFGAFNAVYWVIYLNISPVPTESDFVFFEWLATCRKLTVNVVRYYVDQPVWCYSWMPNLLQWLSAVNIVSRSLLFVSDTL